MKNTERKNGRPFVVCHMLTSIDGKIDGAYMGDPGNAAGRTAFGELRNFYGCEATLYGTVTMLGSYADGPAPEMGEDKGIWELRTDYLAPCDVHNYIVSVDPKGELGFSTGYIEKKGRAKAHVIEVVTDQVSDAYLEYLRGKGVSYLFAGTKYLDCELLLTKLKQKFGIEKLMVSGGGYMNGSFLQEELIDEISIVISPLADGNTKSVSIFERSAFLTEKKPVVFAVKEVKVLDENVVWLRYERK